MQGMNSSQDNGNDQNVNRNPQPCMAESSKSKKLDLIDQGLCDLVLETAPESIKKCIEILQNPDIYKSKISNKILLYGPPGTGKTTLAKIIAQETKISPTWIEGSLLSTEYKNSGAVNLQQIFTPIFGLPEDQNHIVIIDEINCITDRFKNPNNFDANAATTLWRIIDECKDHPNIFLIGTTNDVAELPVQLKSRFSNSLVEINKPVTNESRKKILDYYIKKYTHDCDDKYIARLAKSTKEFEPRELEALIIDAHTDYLFTNKATENKVTKSNIDSVLTLMKKNKTLLYKRKWDYEKIGTQILKYGIPVLSVTLACYTMYSKGKMIGAQLDAMKTQTKMVEKQIEGYSESILNHLISHTRETDAKIDSLKKIAEEEISAKVSFLKNELKNATAKTDAKINSTHKITEKQIAILSKEAEGFWNSLGGRALVAVANTVVLPIAMRVGEKFIKKKFGYT